MLLLNTAGHGSTLQHCDSIIKRGIEYMWDGEHAKSLELLTEARALAEKNRWHKQLFLANNNIGANYYSMLLYGEALNYYLEGYTIAVKELEPTDEMIVLNNIAILYSKEKDYTKAEQYFKRAYDIARENNDNIKRGLYAMNLGNLANETHNIDKAREYILESYEYLKPDAQLFMLAQIGLAENDLLRGNAKQAREKAEKLYKSARNLNFNETGISILFIIAKSYLAEGNYAMAVKSALKILAVKPNAETKKSAFELLAEAHAKNGEYNAALAYKDSVVSTLEQLEEIKNKTLLKSNEVKFGIQEYKSQLEINREKSAAERKLFYYIIAVIIAIVAIIVLILRNISAKHKQKKLIAERNERVIALELEKEKNENLLLENQIKEKETTALLEQERLKGEIEARNRKLSAKALYLSGRNQLIEEVVASLSAVPELSKNPELSNHLNTLKNHLKADDEWESFITHFEEVNQGMLNRLKILHPALTANDIRFVSYVYMNLSTKEIAAMFNITAEACRKRKERIAAKMELPESVSLYDYLSAL
ncbi:tetratricopeptide repeat protein [Flavobacterium sp.]|uniref:tetratricopeptide repeat protein n=1 Tax=Flavobacterium sp. TaxID=239 RepID=UPI00260B4BEA|nr:tetratricopeptide repeat protein [Flavobacterium sp.]